MDLDFGGFEESSRAFPNDLEYELDNLRLESKLSEDGLKFIDEPSEKSYTTCIFNGNVSQAFSFLEAPSSNTVLLSRIYIHRYDDENNDYGSSVGKKDSTRNCVLYLYKMNDFLLIFVEQDQYGSVLIPQLLNSEVKQVIEKSHSVYIFHSEPNSKFKGSYSSDALYYLESSFNNKADLSEVKGLQRLPMPNLIERFSAALLTHCEMERKPCLLVINYTSLSDMLPHVPFLSFIGSCTKLSNLLQFFREFTRSSKMSNSIITNSNLFV